MARYNPDGSLDTTFDADGIVITPSGTRVFEIAIQSDGKLVAAGSSAGDFLVRRYNADGSLDISFGGGDGIVTTQVDPDGAVALDVAIQTDGRIVAAGATGGSNGMPCSTVLRRPNGYWIEILGVLLFPISFR